MTRGETPYTTKKDAPRDSPFFNVNHHRNSWKHCRKNVDSSLFCGYCLHWLQKLFPRASLLSFLQFEFEEFLLLFRRENGRFDR